MWLISALGVPASAHGAEGSALRESYRHLYASTIIPIARLMEEELSEKLETEITFRFPERIRSDISALSRAFASLSSTDPQWAAEVVGLPPPPEADILPPSDTVELPVVPQPNTNGGATNARLAANLHRYQ